MNNIRGIYKGPGELPLAYLLPNELSALQSAVGGYIEAITLMDGVVMLVNEEGKLRNMEPNFRYKDDVIVGPVLFLGTDGEDFSSIEADKARHIIFEKHADGWEMVVDDRT